MTESCPRKLKFVKLIKDVTGYGLLQSKNICDVLCSNFKDYDDYGTLHVPLSIEILNKESYKKLISELPDCGGKFEISGGLDWERNFKILSLGLGNEDDYINFIKEYLNNYKNSEISENILILTLSKLSKQDLQEIFTKIKL